MNEQTPQTAYTVQTKSMLARLMATENIKVEHRSNRKTASFDLKNRTLICPIWKDMSADLYDLLIGHEISHALRTPANGWHDAVIYAGGNAKASKKEQKSFKHFLNVVEDARIEKLLKRQYPGIRRPMIQGYKDLLARDFFGLSAISDFNDLYLIDKLNLAAKIGSSLGIHFTAKENPFYDKLMALETWNDVLFLSRELYAYSKTEQKEGEKKKKELKRQLDEEAQKEREEEEQGKDGEEGEGYEGDEEYNDEGDGEESEEGEESESGGDGADDEEEKADDSTTKKSKDKGEGNRAKSDKNKNAENKNPGTGQDASESENEEFVPKSRTDENFRDMEDKLIETGTTESVYVTIPVPNLKDIVVPASTVNGGLNQYYATKRKDFGVKLLADFKQKNEDYVMLLAKEFEMKKAARSYKLAKISESGDININKLARFRMEDKIFKRLMIVNKGKSHGLVLILDKSGTMGPHIRSAMEQILVMAMFCRKVNIPFVAYSFCNSNGLAAAHDFSNRHGGNPLKQFSERAGDVRMTQLDFRELFNSRMQAAEFNQAIMNHLMLADGLAGGEECYPSHENMGSTPLNEALVVLRDVLRNFKMTHRLDIVNAVIVHDGDSDGNSEYFSDIPNRYSGYNRSPITWAYSNVTIRDTKERLSIQAPKAHSGFTTALLKWIQMTTGCGVFGFYITGTSPRSVRTPLYKMYRNKQGIMLGLEPRYKQSPATDKMLLIENLCKEVIEHKFLESFTEGYTRFFFIPGAEELKIENDRLLDNGRAWTPSRLLSAFKKVSKRKAVSRVLVMKFIDLMAVK